MKNKPKGRSIPKGAPRELIDEGSHNARCVGVIDVGTQPSSNPDWEDQHQIYLLFQAVDEESSTGKPFLLARPFNYVFTPKSNLGKTLDAWLGVEDADFDITEVVGKEAIITVKHNESKKGTFANITAIAPPTKGLKIRKATVPDTILMLDDDFDMDVYEDLPDFYKLKIAASDEGIACGVGKVKGKAKGKQRDEEEEEEEEERPTRRKKPAAKKRGR